MAVAAVVIISVVFVFIAMARGSGVACSLLLRGQCLPSRLSGGKYMGLSKMVTEDDGVLRYASGLFININSMGANLVSHMAR